MILPIVKVSRESINQLALLDRECMSPYHWSLANWLESWENDNLGYWIEIEPQGFQLYSFSSFSEVAHLLKICVLPTCQRQGFAKKWIENSKLFFASMGAKSIYLEVEATNIAAVELYSSLGFKTLLKVESYYSNGASALKMQVTL